LKNRLHPFLAFAGFLLVTIAMYPGVWLGRSELYFDDLARFNLPQRQIAAEIWRSGEVPLWDRYAFGGQPLLAAGQAGVLYPLNALYLFLNPHTALSVSNMLHLALAGTFLYLFLYQLWRRALPAWLGGVIYMTSGFLTGHVVHTQMLNAATWVPLLLFFLERLRQEQRVRDAVGLALTGTLLVLAGHPQIVYYAGLLCSAYIVFLSLGDREGRKPFLSRIIGALLVAALLSAIQLLPTCGLLQRASRHALSFELFAFLPMTLKWLGAVVVPFRNAGAAAARQGDDLVWELAGYAGIVALFLAGTAAAGYRGRDRHVAFFAALGLAGLGVALGDLTHASALLYRLPLANLFRIPARFVFFFDLALAVLAARALCQVIESSEVSPEGGGGTGACPPRRLGAARWGDSRIWLGVGCSLLLAIGLDALRHTSQCPFRVWIIPELYLLATLALFFTVRSHPYVLVGLIGALIIRDNTAYVRRFTRPMMVPVAHARRDMLSSASALPRGLALLQSTRERCRFASFDRTLTGNQPGQYHLEAINGYDMLYPSVYDRMIIPMFPALGASPEACGRTATAFRDRLDLLNVRYILAPHSAGRGEPSAKGCGAVRAEPGGPTGPGAFAAAAQPLRLMCRDGGHAVFRNPTAFPRYWMTPAPENPRVRLPGAQIRELAYRHRELHVCAASSGGWLVVSQLYDPGWRASVDGKRREIQEIGEHLTGIRLPAGRHEVRFRYEPWEWVYGLRISMMGLMVLAAWILRARRGQVW
jgi:membrane protein YfhO